MSKLTIVAAFGAGYVLGARAGRERYDQIAGTAQQVWRDPRVQRQASRAQDVAAQKASQAASTVGAKAAEAATSVQESVKEKVSGHDTEPVGAPYGVGPDVAGTSVPPPNR